MTKDWYRNTNWNPEVEARFFEKLGRARDKAQYLKIQASILAKTSPKSALMLLAKFFELKEEFFLADAFVAAANSHLALGQTEEAIGAYKMALERERIFPNHRTTAWSEFTLLVADRGLQLHFDEAMKVLEENKFDLIFPKLVFAWHGASALIQAQQGRLTLAKERAAKALDAAEIGHSGFSRHRNAGLVGPELSGIMKKLRGIVQE